ncbi:hypothetical protein NRB20_47420 [Nocardia sp. RB20]|uniref:Uncharacterized protein n=1 Tax=Nocardia macrotermitis TaxID=2585198 RepID=A0A7K0D7T0_9NOCA|nr:hypothetical protein [Nocardia macrotermitis]
MDIADFDAALAAIDRKTRKPAVADQHPTTAGGSASSRDGLITVAVSAEGVLTQISLAEDTFQRSSPDRLGHSIVATIRSTAPARRVGAGTTASTESTQNSHNFEAKSVDGGVRVTLDPYGIVSAVYIAKNVFRTSTPLRLSAAIIQTARQANRRSRNTRPAVTPISSAPERSAAPQVAPLPQTMSRNTSQGSTAPPPWDPYQRRSKRYDRNEVVGPSDWDEDLGYSSDPPPSWLQ